MKPVIIFDLDGTLADTGPDLLKALNYSIKPAGLLPLERKDLGHLVGHGSLAMIQRAFALHKHNLSLKEEQQCQNRFLTFYAENIAVDTRLFEGVLELLQRLKMDAYPLAICTNKQEHFAIQLANELAIDGYFNAITGGDSFEYRKPNGQHLISTIELAGGTTNHAIMVGDTVTDIDAAKNASIPVIAVDFGYSDVPVETLKPDHVISHFDQAYALIASL